MTTNQPNQPDESDTYLARCAEALKKVEALGNHFMAENIRAAMREHQARQR